MVGNRVDRGQFTRIPAASLHDGLADNALERSKTEDAMPIVREQELHKAVTETADAVIQHDVGPA